EQIADARRQRMAKRGPEKIGDEAGRAFGGLERDVAGPTVRHDDIYRAGADIVAFDEAKEIDRRTGLAQPGRGGAHRLMALHVLGADIEKADRRMFLAEHGA